MKRISLMKWLLEVDLNKTREFYSKDIELCDCLFCENYMTACMYSDPSVIGLFNVLGINPAKPSHLSEFGEMEDGLRLYIGSYHIVGKLIEGEYSEDSDWNDTNTARIKNVTFGFKKELLFYMTSCYDLARIPWVLNEKPKD